MTIEAKIVGFDRSSDLVAFELDVPNAVLEQVKKIAKVPASDPDLLGSYPLSQQQIAMIADAAHARIDPAQCKYFLEAYEG
jgi:hypothetical protein